MDNMSGFKKIRVTGHPSVTTREVRILPGYCRIVLLIGPTGSGKSSFVECIADDKSLGIAKDQLEGVTQSLTVYKLTNVQQVLYPSNPIFLIDTPGFADSRFPESKTLGLVLEWIKKQCVKSESYPRMAGSKGKLLDLLKELTGKESGENISIVTTMWDQLWKEEQINRANKRLEEMGSIYYKSFVQAGARILKFDNTHASALHVVDECLIGKSSTYFSFENVVLKSEAIASTSLGRALYQNLIERQESLAQRLKVIEDDLSDESSRSNPELEDVLLKQQKEAMADLALVEEELKGFPPVAQNELGLGRTTTSPEPQFEEHS
ncbi:hypothetical protein CVT24_013400 [Panaeolus cyanescens]|uniref:G domain-containing protein n=1 Tax=Panaeolus cyanescens TaxID=181874 RepID=A0A409YML7_9AGAR|nr:hypothetical protein CVT24_013400 [Panaeolus cyanescens]